MYSRINKMWLVILIKHLPWLLLTIVIMIHMNEFVIAISVTMLCVVIAVSVTVSVTAIVPIGSVVI